MSKIWTKNIVILTVILAPYLTLNAQLIHIPDTNLRAALRDLGYIKNDSLDIKLIKGNHYLKLQNKRIENIEGLERIRHLKGLFLTSNMIISINHLPPNLEILNLSKNRLTALPAIPSTMIMLNYFENQISKDSLPLAFRNIDCTDPYQNCLPFQLRNTDVFKDSIPHYGKIVSFHIEISGLYSNRKPITNEITYEKKGKYFVSKGIQTAVDDTLAAPKLEKHRLKFEASKLDHVLNAIREKRVDFDICAGDSLIHIELNDKMDIRSYDGMTHRRYIDITYKFTTTSGEFSITDIVLDDRTVESMAGFSARSKHLNVHMMVQWLYMYQLTNLSIPNTKLTNKYFTEENLKVVYDWSLRTTKNR